MIQQNCNVPTNVWKMCNHYADIQYSILDMYNIWENMTFCSQKYLTQNIYFYGLICSMLGYSPSANRLHGVC